MKNIHECKYLPQFDQIFFRSQTIETVSNYVLNLIDDTERVVMNERRNKPEVESKMIELDGLQEVVTKVLTPSIQTNKNRAIIIQNERREATVQKMSI